MAISERTYNRTTQQWEYPPADTGHDVPPGGTTGQVLRKQSSSDYDAIFSTVLIDDVSGLSTALNNLDGRVTNAQSTANAASSAISAHSARTDNPHSVTKTHVGLSSVPNLDTTNAVNKAHDAVTIGTANGLSLTGQAISLATATNSTPGAMSAADKTNVHVAASVGATANGLSQANQVFSLALATSSLAGAYPSTHFTLVNGATDAATAGTLAKRDASGNISFAKTTISSLFSSGPVKVDQSATMTITGDTQQASGQADSLASYARDGNTGTFWGDNNSTSGPWYLTLDFASARTINQYQMLMRAANGNSILVGRMLKDWKFQGSNDNSTWTDLDVRVSQPAWTDNAYKTFNFTNSTAYRYYRLYITATQTAGNYPHVAELVTVYQGDITNVFEFTAGGRLLVGKSAVDDDGVNRFQLNGSAAFANDVQVNTQGNGFIAKSPNGNRWRLTPTDAGGTLWTGPL